VLVAAQRGKVDETLVRVLDHSAEPVDRVHAAGNRLQRSGDLLVELDQPTRVETTTVPGDLRREPAAPAACIGEPSPLRDQLFDQRTDL